MTDPRPQIPHVLMSIEIQFLSVAGPLAFSKYHILMEILFQIAILIFSVIIHEVSHGYAALMLGDQTAKRLGRLTLNPIPHIDPIGSIVVPALLIFSGSSFLIGWAKPVPYNSYNLRNQRWGDAIVSAAGPLANLFMALLFGLVIRSFPLFPLGELPDAFMFVIAYIVVINIVLAIFNLLPIPPLDGSKVFFSFLPYQYRRLGMEIEARYGMLPLILILVFFSTALSFIILPIMGFLFTLFSGQRLF